MQCAYLCGLDGDVERETTRKVRSVFYKCLLYALFRNEIPQARSMAEAVMAVMAIKAPSSKAHDGMHHKEPVHCAKRASAVRTKQTGSPGGFEQARAVDKEKDRHCHKLSAVHLYRA